MEGGGGTYPQTRSLHREGEERPAHSREPANKGGNTHVDKELGGGLDT